MSAVTPPTPSSTAQRTYAVVMPVYNREAYLEAAIRSALDQERPPEQVIIVDDGSTDRSVEIARSFGPPVEVYQQANAGCAAARNNGVGNARTSHIAFLDSDDAWFPWTLRRVDEALDQLDAVGKTTSVVELQRLDFQEQPPSVDRLLPLPSLVVDHHQDLIERRRVVATSVMVVTRQAFDAAGGFVALPMNGTDAEFNLRVGVQPGYAQLQGPPMVAYRDHDGNVMKNLRGTYDGIAYMIEQEKAHGYPGGSARAADRRAFITSQVRSMSLQAIQRRQASLGWSLYWKSFGWNLAAGRGRYLLAFPLLALKHKLFG